MERKSGFYWVKYSDESNYEVAEYDSAKKLWMRTWCTVEFSDCELYVINENRIMSPDEWE